MVSVLVVQEEQESSPEPGRQWGGGKNPDHQILCPHAAGKMPRTRGSGVLGTRGAPVQCVCAQCVFSVRTACVTLRESTGLSWELTSSQACHKSPATRLRFKQAK